MLRRVTLVRTDVSEELSASILRVTRRDPIPGSDIYTFGLTERNPFWGYRAK
jgi:hypothetical protein